MAEECIFCKIVRGEIPCAKVFESDSVLAFLDISPVNKGHALVIPKDHYPTMFDIPVSHAEELHAALQSVGRGVMLATKADGLNLGMNNYKAAGQLVAHAHYHLIPRFEGDGLTLWSQNPYDNQEEMQQLAAAIQNAIV